jgi:hypothetical protein
MIIKNVRAIVATALVSAMALGSGVQTARADTTSTLLITAAAVAALMTGINVAQKNAKANTLVGYMPNGAPVYADGGVVAPNGKKWYPGNYGENISCNSGRCYIVGVGANGYGYPGGYGYPAAYGGYQPAYGYPGGYAGYPAGYAAPAQYVAPTQYVVPATTVVTRTIVVRKHGGDDDDDQGNGHRHHHDYDRFEPPN